jgi:AcrR family transcriptional regulator
MHTQSRLLTTQKIIQSAADLFLKRGFSSVSMDLIAEAAEVTKVTIYQHFKSKEVLLLHCLRWRLDSREGSLEAHFRGKAPSATQVLEVFDWLAQRSSKGNYHGCAFLKATQELGSTVPEVRVIALEAKRLMRKRLMMMLSNGGVLHPEQLADTLALLIEGAQALSLIEQGSRPFKAARREAASLLALDIKGLPVFAHAARGAN